MTRPSYLLVTALVAAVALAAGFLLARAFRAPAQAGPLARQLPAMEGPARALDSWQGMPRVVNFWATWCAPCREEIPMLNRLQADRPGRVQVIGVAIDEPAAVREFARELPLAYPVLLAPREGNALMRSLGNPRGVLPYSVILDAGGRTVASRAGAYTRDELEADLQALP